MAVVVRQDATVAIPSVAAREDSLQFEEVGEAHDSPTPFTFVVAVLTGWPTERLARIRELLQEGRRVPHWKWLNERKGRILEFLQEENRVLRRQLGKKRFSLTDDERCGLAAKGVHLGRKLLAEVASIVTPDTIVRWHRELIAKKWSRRGKRCRRGKLSARCRRRAMARIRTTVVAESAERAAR